MTFLGMFCGANKEQRDVVIRGQIETAQTRVTQAENILNTLGSIYNTISHVQSALGTQADQVKIALSEVSERVRATIEIFKIYDR